MGNRDKKKKRADSRDIMEAELTELDEWLNEDKRSEKGTQVSGWNCQVGGQTSH